MNAASFPSPKTITALWHQQVMSSSWWCRYNRVSASSNTGWTSEVLVLIFINEENKWVSHIVQCADSNIVQCEIRQRLWDDGSMWQHTMSMKIRPFLSTYRRNLTITICLRITRLDCDWRKTKLATINELTSDGLFHFLPYLWAPWVLPQASVALFDSAAAHCWVLLWLLLLPLKINHII